jgi:hypothetical protein
MREVKGMEWRIEEKAPVPLTIMIILNHFSCRSMQFGLMMIGRYSQMRRTRGDSDGLHLIRSLFISVTRNLAPILRIGKLVDSPQSMDMNPNNYRTKERLLWLIEMIRMDS